MLVVGRLGLDTAPTPPREEHLGIDGSRIEGIATYVWHLRLEPI